MSSMKDFFFGGGDLHIGFLGKYVYYLTYIATIMPGSFQNWVALIWPSLRQKKTIYRSNLTSEVSQFSWGFSWTLSFVVGGLTCPWNIFIIIFPDKYFWNKCFKAAKVTLQWSACFLWLKFRVRKLLAF